MNNEILQKIKENALNEHIPILMDDTLEVIIEILKSANPSRILEIGTAVGYSASCFAKYTNENCIIDTIEIDEQRYLEAKDNIEKLELKNRINIYFGNAVEILPTLKEIYDIVFIDAAKGKYPIFLNEAIRMTKKGSIIVADNILYKGYVMSDYNKHKQRTAVRNLREYIREAMENSQLETKILEVGDGLAITIIK